MGQIISTSYDMIAPYLKPEHKKWLDNNYSSDDAENLGKRAHAAAMIHPDYRGALAKHHNALSALTAAMDTPQEESARPVFEAASENLRTVYAQKFAEHLGEGVDEHIATAPQREAQERIAKATEEGKNQPIVKTRNGKYVAGCLKCQGSGVIPRFGNTADGMCFDCKGVGYNPRGAVEHDSAESLRQTMIDSRVARAQEPIIPRNNTASPAEAAPAPTERRRGFANKFPGNCVGCNTRVGKGEGMTSKGPSDNWEVRCVGCHHG